MAEVVSPDTPVSKLECKVAFENLSDNEKLYAHYLSRASFEGGLIVLLQTSPESVPIFLLLQELFGGQSVQELKDLGQCTEDEWKVGAFAEVSNNIRCYTRIIVVNDIMYPLLQALVTYAAAFYCNMGNYKGFGDTKFIPGLPKVNVHACALRIKLHSHCIGEVVFCVASFQWLQE